jgi:acyl-CoA synthetase (AMP-forming)/AMP-acid ligase II
MPDDDLGERVCLYAVPKEGADLELADVTDYIEDDMAAYKLPERLEVVNQIPRNPVGKILKTDLRDEIRSKIEEASN